MPTQLLIQFPSSTQWPGWTSSQYLLTNIDLNPSSSSSVGPSGSKDTPTTSQKVVSVTIDPHGTYADYFSDASVFRAYPSTSFPPSDSEAPGPSFALKFAFREDLIASLAAEATIYTNYLHSLQGTVVPKCHGLFLGSPLISVGFGRGEDADDRDADFGDKGIAACLMLEWWGESVNRTFKTLDLDTRLLIISRLASIHRAGLVHGDFAERNVLIESATGDIRLIDFDIMAKHEGCRACDRDFSTVFIPGQDELKEDGVQQEEKLVNGMNGLSLISHKPHPNGVGGMQNGITLTTSTPPPASNTSHSHRLQMMYEDEEEEEDDGFLTAEGRQFGCEQLYDVCRILKVWD